MSDPRQDQQDYSAQLSVAKAVTALYFEQIKQFLFQAIQFGEKS
jgi:hypothetical protein